MTEIHAAAAGIAATAACVLAHMNVGARVATRRSPQNQNPSGRVKIQGSARVAFSILIVLANDQIVGIDRIGAAPKTQRVAAASRVGSSELSTGHAHLACGDGTGPGQYEAARGRTVIGNSAPHFENSSAEIGRERPETAQIHCCCLICVGDIDLEVGVCWPASAGRDGQHSTSTRYREIGGAGWPTNCHRAANPKGLPRPDRNDIRRRVVRLDSKPPKVELPLVRSSFDTLVEPIDVPNTSGPVVLN